MKYRFDELLKIEKEQILWEVTFRGCPVWIFSRPAFLEIPNAPSYAKTPGIVSLIMSTFGAIRCFFLRDRQVFFIPSRKDSYSFVEYNGRPDSFVFINYESNTASQINGFKSVYSNDFFNVARFVFRKIAWLFHRGELSRIVEAFNEKTLQVSPAQVKIAIGDICFNKFLGMLLGKKREIYYTLATVPLSEKFLKLLNSCEIQHGVIHFEHPSYAYIPGNIGKLAVYREGYVKKLNDMGVANAFYNEFKVKKLCAEKKELQQDLDVVFYSQPIERYSKAIEKMIKELENCGIKSYLQPHPKDMYNYDIDSNQIISNSSPARVKIPVVYFSSIIEDFLILKTPVLAFDAGEEGVDDFLKFFRPYEENEILPFKQISEIIKYIINQLS